MISQVTKKIWAYTIVIILFGLVSLYSASFDNVRVSSQVFYDQLLFAGIGIVTMYGLSRINYRRFYDWAYVLYGASILVLSVVLVSGRHALGAKRWLEIGGLSFQPSEFAKLALILMLARYLSNRRPTLSFNFRSRIHVILNELVIPFALTGLLMLLIFRQPDLGTALLLMGIFLAMVFANDLEIRYVIGFLLFCLIWVPFGWHVLKPYQKDRLLVFLNPNIDPLGAGYTIIQSKIAVGSGQLFGNGWLAGTQNQLNFLPERHTDFIFSVIGEEWGLVGSIFLIYCYLGLILLGVQIAASLKDRFASLLSVGIVAILSLQVVINIGMVIGLLPIVGLTLPLVSYGRSSFLLFMVLLGILLSLNKRRTIF